MIIFIIAIMLILIVVVSVIFYFKKSRDAAPKGSETSLLIFILEIICGFAILLAIISTIIAWRVYVIRTGGY